MQIRVNDSMHVYAHTTIMVIAARTPARFMGPKPSLGFLRDPKLGVHTSDPTRFWHPVGLVRPCAWRCSLRTYCRWGVHVGSHGVSQKLRQAGVARMLEPHLDSQVDRENEIDSDGPKFNPGPEVRRFPPPHPCKYSVDV